MPRKRRETITVPHTHIIDGHPVATWIEPIIAYARRHGWKGVINSGYRSVEEQARLYEKYKNSGFNSAYMAAKPGQSNHNGAEYPRGAIDVSQPRQFRDIIKGWKGKHKLVWAEDIGLGDFVHFSSTGR